MPLSRPAPLDWCLGKALRKWYHARGDSPNVGSPRAFFSSMPIPARSPSMSPLHPDRPEVPRLPEPPAPVRSPDSRRARLLPRFQVILHGDATHDLMFVVRSVM